MLVLGVDPGTRITGYGAVARTGGRFVCVARGVIRPGSSLSLPQRLLALHDRLGELVRELTPDAIAVEDCFLARNLRSTLALGQVKGLVLVVAARQGIDVFEYAPRRVKQAVVGNGNASKEQVRFMIERMVTNAGAAGQPPGRSSLDLSDALAVAVCHHHQARGASARALEAVR